VAPRLPAAQRRTQLVDAAMQIFAAEGYQKTTMDAVAAAAGVTKPVLYQHFPSKRDLFLELLRTVGRHLTEMVNLATSGAESPRAQVEQGFHAYFEFVESRPDEFRVLFGEGVRVEAEFAAEVLTVERGIAGIVAELIITEGLSKQERLVLGHGIVGMAERTGRHWIDSGRTGSAQALASGVADLAWSGLRGRPR